MIEFNEIIIWISTLIWTLLPSFILIFCCKQKRQKQPSQKSDGKPALKSKRCNTTPGLLKDDPDLKSEEKGEEKALPGDGADDKLILSNKHLSREPTVTKDQCDTDLRSLLSVKNRKHKNEIKKLSLEPTQEDVEVKTTTGKNGKSRDGKGATAAGAGSGGKIAAGAAAQEQPTQNDSDKRTILQVTQNENTDETPGKAGVGTKDNVTMKKAAPPVPDIDGKSAMHGKSVMVAGQPGGGGKSTPAVRKAAVVRSDGMLKHGKATPSVIKPLKSLASPAAGGGILEQSKYVAT